jgi:hypothetical protein
MYNTGCEKHNWQDEGIIKLSTLMCVVEIMIGNLYL